MDGGLGGLWKESISSFHKHYNWKAGGAWIKPIERKTYRCLSQTQPDMNSWFSLKPTEKWSKVD